MTTSPDLYRPAYRSKSATPAEMLAMVTSSYLFSHGFFNHPLPAQWASHVRLLCAQVLHEGYKWANNVGGLKRIKGYPWTSLGTHEVLPALTCEALKREGRATAPKFPHKCPPGYAAVYLLPGPNASPATHFAAFDSLGEGVSVWVGKIVANYSTADAVKALDACNPHEYAAALKKAYYFTADAGEYGHALASHLATVPEPEGQTYADQLLARVTQ